MLLRGPAGPGGPDVGSCEGSPQPYHAVLGRLVGASGPRIRSAAIAAWSGIDAGGSGWYETGLG